MRDELAFWLPTNRDTVIIRSGIEPDRIWIFIIFDFGHIRI